MDGNVVDLEVVVEEAAEDFLPSGSYCMFPDVTASHNILAKVDNLTSSVCKRLNIVALDSYLSHHYPLGTWRPAKY